METFLFALEIIGTVAFSVSGAMTAIKKNMDLFGVVILGLVTAVGGGVIRDLVLGITPPATFRNPVYSIVSVFCSLAIFLTAVRRALNHHHRLYDFTLFLMDSLGLGVFTVVGVRTAWLAGQGENLFLLTFVGVITGVGGGILRDVLAQQPPYIFVKHVYAVASLLGALACGLLWRVIPAAPAMAVGALMVVTVRCLSAHYHWSLPHPHAAEETEGNRLT